MRAIRLKPSDAERYARLRRTMLECSPWAFSATPEDDRALDLEYLRSALAREHEAIVAIEADPAPEERYPITGTVSEVAAAAGLFRGAAPKFAHRARVWGVFVAPAHRGKGCGRALLTAVTELARSWAGVDFLDLAVSENSPEALRLYESLGFEAWGREPETLEHAGRRYDEIYMTLRL